MTRPTTKPATGPRGPVLFDLSDTPRTERVSPADAPPVPDLTDPVPSGQAMATVAAITARPPSRLAKWFWALASTLVGIMISLALWSFVTRLIEQMPLLGWLVAALTAAFVVVALMIALREIASFSRLARIDTLHRAAAEARENADLPAARKFIADLTALYKNRDETRWGRDRLAEGMADQFDADSLLALAEHELMTPLDLAARREVETAARQVATVTALVPIALADVASALTANVRMIRRIAEIYGGRSGTLGSWRLTRAVMSHLVATGAVAVGDDMLEPILGGGLLGKLSRRFGEGLVNGALTARVGAATMEVCRPMPFVRIPRPSARSMVKSALTGLFSSNKDAR